MEDKEYAIAYKEVLEILKYIPEEDFKKLPNNVLELYKENCDKDYSFSYDPEKTLEEQNVSKRARAIIGILFRDYWATPTQKQKIISRQRYERRKLEEEKKLKYHNILDQNKSMKIINNNNNEEKDRINNLPVEIKKENYLRKLVTIIKKIIFRK